ncbi:MAG: BMP family protein [Thermoanaerobacteraceae bacterium]|nr:BMP family protein [Thermoanaerobacteraceae bacterium]
MIKYVKKTLGGGLFIALWICLALVGCSFKGEQPTKEAEPLSTVKTKVALLLPGPISDKGWNASAYEGLMMAKEKFGFETAYRENLGLSDIEEAFRVYAQEGYDIIIGHGFQFGDPAKKVAKEFPKIKFLITSSNIFQEPNVASLDILNKQVGFLGGVAAALITKSNKIGFVGGMAIPSIIIAQEGFAAGAKYAKPDVQVLSTLIGSFDDVAKAKETALAYIGQGADIIMHDADQGGLGVIHACKEKNVLAIGYGKDQSDLAPENLIVSSIQSVPAGLTYVLQEIVEGRFAAKAYEAGIKQGATGLVWNEHLAAKHVSPEVRKKIDDIIREVADGKINIDELIRAVKEKK